MLQFSEKLLNNLMQIGLTVSLAALVPLILRRLMKKRYPARMVCGVGDSRAAAAHSGAADTAAGAGAGHAAHQL